MLMLVTYDVSTETPEGQKRLRQVAKCCIKYGQRVQKSVFECVIDEGQYRKFQVQLLKIIDLEKDSLRFYNLGRNYQGKVEHFGVTSSYELEGVLIL
jgi:CRISPR-associated protein Cas2